MAVAVDLSHEYEVADRVRLTNDVAETYRARIQRHAHRIARRLPRHVLTEDLLSAGFRGLVDAFRNFDPTRMESLDAYIDHRVRGSILDELRTHDPLSRDRRMFVRRMQHAQQALVPSLGREPSDAEVASEMKLPLAVFRSRLARANEMASRHACDPEGSVEDNADGTQLTPEESFTMREERAVVARAMLQLTDRQRSVLRMHYQEEMTLRQIGERLGVTESRISQIHAEAVARLRGLLERGQTACRTS